VKPVHPRLRNDDNERTEAARRLGAECDDGLQGGGREVGEGGGERLGGEDVCRHAGERAKRSQDAFAVYWEMEAR
jgi:hypothetical protein